MDKSFNDQELSDIMKEIEALEDDFKQETEEVHHEPHASHEDVLQDLVEMKQDVAIPLRPAHRPAPAATHAPKATGTTMSFKVSGDLQMDLQFDVGGKVVSLSVSERGLDIQMDGGMTFHVPMTDKKVA